MPKYEFESIGYIQTPFKQRFGIPHQPGISESAKGIIFLENNPDYLTAIKRLSDFSHIWIIFVFHNHGGNKWKPSIRPPRLGGAEKVGLFASRSPHRPNPIGISAVKLDHILIDDDRVQIHVTGVDLLDGTPILDIKPYIPLADKIDHANQGWADIPVKKYPIEITDVAESTFKKIEEDAQIEIRHFAIEMIQLDPRPAYQKRQIPVGPENVGKKFGLTVKNFDVKYEITKEGFLITAVLPIIE